MLPTLAAAVLLLGQEPATGAPAVRVSSAAAKAGDAFRVRTAVTQRLTVQSIVAGTTVNEFPRETDEPRSFEVKVTAVEADRAEAVVTYTHEPDGRQSFRIAAGPEPGRDRSVRVAVAGATGEADPEDGDLLADDHAARIVAADAHELLLGGRLVPVLAERELAIGQPITVPQDVASEVFGALFREGAVRSLTLTPLREEPLHGEAAVVFAAALEAESRDGTDVVLDTRFELHGELRVGRDHGRIVAADLTGPVRFSGSSEHGDTPLEVRGSGTLAYTLACEPIPGGEAGRSGADGK